MFNKKRAFSLILAIVMVLGSITVFAGTNEKQEKLQWIEGPSLGEVKNKKVEIHGRLEIPQEYKGFNIVKLTVDGFNVVPKNDGLFSETIFTGPEVEIQVKVFVGKNEVSELARNVYYLEDKSRVYEVMAMIDTFPELEDLNIRDKDDVIEARLAYDKLTDFEKKVINNLDKLVSVEVKMAELVAENAIKQLPLFDDIRIEHKNDVLAVMELVNKAKELNPNALIDGEDLLVKMLAKIDYLEKELADNYFLPNILMSFPQTSYYNYSEMKFEGYVTNMKYLDKVFVHGQEAEIEYIEDAVVRNLDGSVLYMGPAYKFEKTLILEDGAQAIKVEAISQSGKKGGWARRFWIDTTPPELDIVVKDRDITSDKVELEINMMDNFGYMELYLFDNFEYLHDKGHSYNYPSKATTTISVDLEMGKNELVFTLKDIVDNETVETITINREEPKPVAKGKVQISLYKDSTSSTNKINFDTISNFYIKNKATGEEFNIGSTPWNGKERFIMDNIPEGEYTIHFDMPDAMNVKEIQLGESYKETIYNPDTNPLVVVDRGKTGNYVKIVLKSEVALKEIKPLGDLVVPTDITIDEFKVALPKHTTIVDSLEKEHQVDLSWDIRPFVFDGWEKPGEVNITSEFFNLPIGISNTDPATRLEVWLKVIFKELSIIVSLENPDPVTVEVGAPVEMPETVVANMSDGSTQEVPVTWDPATVDTSTQGEKIAIGTVEGFDKIVIFTVIVEEPKSMLHAYYYHDVVSPFVTKTILVVNVENLEGATRYRARYINDRGTLVSTNTVKLGEEVQIGSGKIDPTNIEIVIMNDSDRDNIVHIFQDVNPIKIEK